MQGVHVGAVQPTGDANIVREEGWCVVSVAELHTSSYRSIASSSGMVDIFKLQHCGKLG